ncbi:uncharacterized protein LOC141907639 [Tubulanus polymorphus]|uniref:uncharacterized protein LOC141907639 n=1 Tax=Tubulanus polymorphus TaxID=672921 RepID=UPI003DA1DE2F
MKLLAVALIATYALSVVMAEYHGDSLDRLEDGLEPSLRSLQMALDAAWELQKRASDPLEKRGSEEENELLQNLVDDAAEKVMKRKAAEVEAAREDEEPADDAVAKELLSLLMDEDESVLRDRRRRPGCIHCN